jgi:hypothetical protein
MFSQKGHIDRYGTLHLVVTPIVKDLYGLLNGFLINIYTWISSSLERQKRTNRGARRIPHRNDAIHNMCELVGKIY